jgi:hypothetical protein
MWLRFRSFKSKENQDKEHNIEYIRRKHILFYKHIRQVSQIELFYLYQSEVEVYVRLHLEKF